MYRIIYPFIILLSLLNASPAFSQHERVYAWYDLQKTQVKENYFVLRKNSIVKDSLFISYFQNGKIQSKGMFIKNKTAGDWEFYYENGNLKMKGELKDNNPVGKWIYFYENGGLNMEGEIEKGQKEGEWKFYYENGLSKSKGIYNKGKKDGHWRYFNEGGEFKAEAEFVNDKGVYIEYFPSGTVKSRGNIEGNKSNGNWKYYHENGIIKAEGEEKNGLKEGYWKFYYPDSTVSSEGNYLGGNEDGNWKYYHDNGVISAIGDNKEGKKDGYWKLYYKDGGFKGEGHFKHGDGEYKEFYESGKLKIQGNVKDGKNDGEWKYFYESGELEGKCFFNEGKGYYKGYYENGTLKMEGMIEDGNKVGIWKLYDESGELAGYYKTYYQNDVPYFEPLKDGAKDSAIATEPVKPKEKPPVTLPRPKPRVYTSKVNEYKDFLLAMQPLGIFKNQLGFSLEFYYQERLGFELGGQIQRKPLKTPDVFNEEYIRGFSVYFRQKFYQKDQDIGMFYWAQEIRYSDIDHFVLSPNSVGQTLLNANERQYTATILIGDRLLADARKRGWTLDLFGGLGVGFRTIKRNYASSPQLDRLFGKLRIPSLFVPFRLGISIGYLF